MLTCSEWSFAESAKLIVHCPDWESSDASNELRRVAILDGGFRGWQQLNLPAWLSAGFGGVGFAGHLVFVSLQLGKVLLFGSMKESRKCSRREVLSTA